MWQLRLLVVIFVGYALYSIFCVTGHMDRRHFLKCITAAAATPALNAACVAVPHQFGALKPDPGALLDLADGLSYTIVSRVGTPMSDGVFVPGAHDGMAAFGRDDGRIALVCNHETLAGWPEESGFSDGYEKVPAAIRDRLYDRGNDVTPALGGTTTTIWNPETRETERQFLSLGGTELNCAGGPTPWGSWLSCEEIFSAPGPDKVNGNAIVRDQRHGYVFEVPSSADSIVEPVPLRDMGRFEHEAAAVDPSTGFVYLTEDQHYSLLYRFLPTTPGKLADGGRLQALAIGNGDSIPAHNWGGNTQMAPGQPVDCHWLDLDNVDTTVDDLRKRGAAAGAATFARGEGACWADDRLAFTCTIGGPARLGQVFTYRPMSRDEGLLELVAEATPGSLLRNADNLTMAPWGDLVVCEDTAGPCGLVGIRPDGSQYAIASNAYSNSELAGVCFSPDGETLFVNIQYPGTTVAITGRWP